MIGRSMVVVGALLGASSCSLLFESVGEDGGVARVDGGIGVIVDARVDAPVIDGGPGLGDANQVACADYAQDDTTQWTESNEYCYIFISTRVTYDDAVLGCAKLDGFKLVEIRDVTEQEKLVEFSSKLPLSDSVGWIWQGLTDVDSEGDFTWESDGSEATFMPWASGQPDDKGTLEDCVAYHTSGTWNDQNCSNQPVPYVCQRPLP